ncbi:MAG: type II toxin-antitoxin system VapC family toxin [Syntrophales bacterium LBB04]|nr:type II toxin-antitoxin system VapC family toxin [Syntrophales bacterium LBB04]
MILYCDSSALIKRYVEEAGSEQVDRLFADHPTVITSTVAFAEIMAAFRKKYREGILSKSGYLKTVSEFKKEYEKITLVSITTDLNQIIEGLLLKHSLRGFDAIHLASALLVRKEGPLKVRFACFDHLLNKAAIAEGILVSL